MGINIKDIAELFKEHLEQQPYRCLCNECGRDMTVLETRVDKDFDNTMTVEPCVCLGKDE